MPMRSFRFLLPFFACLLPLAAGARTFSARCISPTNTFCRQPSVSATGAVAWLQTAPDEAHPGSTFVDMIYWKDGKATNLRAQGFACMPERPALYGDDMVFVGRASADQAGRKLGGKTMEDDRPMLTDEQKKLTETVDDLFTSSIGARGKAGGKDATLVKAGPEASEHDAVATNKTESAASRGGSDIYLYSPANGLRGITAGQGDVFMPVAAEGGAAWQVARIWPYGYDIAVWKRSTDSLHLVTTNFYYMLSPSMQGNKVAFQGWDGFDYEIYLYDLDSGALSQLTDNTFDDVAPSVWGNQVAYVSYPSLTAEIFLWEDGNLRKLSSDTKDNASPHIWEGKVVWQGFDGEDTEIYLYDGEKTMKLSSNTWDDEKPVFADNVVAWISYVDGWDAEVMALDLADNITSTLSENNTEDVEVRTAGGKVVWQSNMRGASSIWLAE
jgi:beta propeller repeat protein